jgi:hypothetical protein
VKKLGRNQGRYHGEPLDLGSFSAQLDAAVRQHGWRRETFGERDGFPLLALQRRPAHARRFIYVSAGIHGDEPAGPLGLLRVLEENIWPADAEIVVCPLLNPSGFVLNQRENREGVDLNRQYRAPEAAEVVAHIAWLKRQPKFDVAICLHEDWEAHGFYLYELNPDGRPSLAPPVIRDVASVCPIDPSPEIDGREARGGVIAPVLVPTERPEWPEAFYLFMHHTRQSYTFEAPSDFALPVRVNAIATALRAALVQGN